MIIANDKTLAEVLRNLCNDRDYLEAVSLESILYVHKSHNYEYLGEKFSRMIHALSPV